MPAQPLTQNYVTLDILASTLYSTFLHPLLCTLPSTIILARGIPPSSPVFQYSLAYIALVLTLRLYLFVDERFAYGSSRSIEWQNEVVLITGGAGGLGGLIAEVFGLRGIATAILDLAPATSDFCDVWESKGVSYYQCDVADDEAITRAKDRIVKDIGTPTIIIHAAAIVSGGSLLSLPPQTLRKTFTVNALSFHNLTKTFLPGMLETPHGGTFVTISSVLGELGCAGLAAYTASKAALSVLHETLRAEVRIMAADHDLKQQYPGLQNVRFVLCRPGQLGTSMFGAIKPPNEFLGPTVATAELATAIVKAIDQGRDAEVDLPLYARWIGIMKVLPVGLRTLARQAAGLDRAGWDAYGTKATRKRL